MFQIEIADKNLEYRTVQIDDSTPTGSQLAGAAGFKPNQNPTVLRVLQNGVLEDIRPDEIADIRVQPGRFIVIESDRSFRFLIDGTHFDWPCQIVSGGLLRKLGSIPANYELIYEHQEAPGKVLSDLDLVDLASAGIESFTSRKIVWKLKVQGIEISSETPLIVARDAISKAGFNPDQGWQIFLKIVDHPKKVIDLSTVVDLRTPGIEKIRLTPNEINNGESGSACAASNLARQFSLQEADEEFLEKTLLNWETLVDVERRWLLIHGFQVPAGYKQRETTLALEIPTTYPGAQIDMFYAYPPFELENGMIVDRTQVRAVIRGSEFHGWSRHRGPNSPWIPETDNVITHLALVESALLKEVGQ